MIASFLENKLVLPSLSSYLINRPRLVNKLDQLSSFKIAFVHSYAGTGKTTLLNEWVRLQKWADIAWISLDDQKNSLCRFWEHVIAALTPLGKIKYKKNNVSRDFFGREELDALIGWITREIHQEIVLVLDDLHFIDDILIYEYFDCFINYLPNNVHVVLVSKTIPPLALSQFRVRNQLLEIKQDELSFLTEEAIEFLCKFTGKDFQKENIELLNNKLEGWIAGLQVAAMTLRNIEPVQVKEFINTFTGDQRDVADYFTEQIFDRQPERIRNFLLSTSIFEKFSTDSCNFVLEVSDSQYCMEWLEKYHLFVVPLDDKRIWYRYHSLFKEFLFRRYSLSSSFDILLNVHRRAAVWFNTFKLPKIAIKHAILTGDYNFSIYFMEEFLNESEWKAIEINDLRQWLTILPSDSLRNHPNLCMSFSWKLAVLGRLDENLPYIKIVEDYCKTYTASKLNNLPVSEQQFRSESHGQWENSVEFYYANINILKGHRSLFQGEINMALEYFQKAIQLIPINDAYFDKANALYYLGLCFFLMENIDSAIDYLHFAAEVSFLCKNHKTYLAAYSTLASVSLLLGRLGEADHYIQFCLDYEIEAGLEILVGNLSGLGRVSVFKNKIEEASGVFTSKSEPAHSNDGIFDVISANIERSYCLQSMGDINSASALLSKTYNMAVQNKYFILKDIVECRQVRLWLDVGKYDKSFLWASRVRSKTSKVPFVQELQYLTWIYVMLETGELHEAKVATEKIQEDAIANRRNEIVLETFILSSAINEKMNFFNLAEEKLLQAIKVAVLEESIYLFAPVKKYIQPVLERFVRQNKPFFSNSKIQDFVFKLLNFYSSMPPANFDSETECKNRQMLIAPLSIRELQILKLVAFGNTYEKVAQKLVVAPSTIRWHIKNIFQKLNAHSSMEAVSIARELKIL